MLSKKISNAYIIAEVGQAHDGSLGLAHSFIDAAKQSGADAVKFQTHIAAAESSFYEPFRIPFSYEDSSRYDYWKRTSFTPEQWLGLKSHCDDVQLDFLSSPFSIAALNLLESIEVKQYKIASGEIQNFLLIDAIAKLHKPMIISTGLADIKDIEACISRITNYHQKFSLLQCTTAYPTPPELIGLNLIQYYKDLFNCPVGLSDHSGKSETCLAAVSLGASIIECHLTFDKAMFGPDSKASLTCKEFKRMVDSIRFLECILNNPSDPMTPKNPTLKNTFGKSLSINKALKKGAILTLSDLESKKPAGKGISCSHYENFLGRKLSKDLAARSFLQESDFA